VDAVTPPEVEEPDVVDDVDGPEGVVPPLAWTVYGIESETGFSCSGLLSYVARSDPLNTAVYVPGVLGAVKFDWPDDSDPFAAALYNVLVLPLTLADTSAVADSKSPLLQVVSLIVVTAVIGAPGAYVD
jgi:hypothetical protein